MAAVAFEPDEVDEFGLRPADNEADNIPLSPYGSMGASPQQAWAQLRGGAVQIVANLPRSLALWFGATSALHPVSCADPSEVGVALPRVHPASDNRSGQTPKQYV